MYRKVRKPTLLLAAAMLMAASCSEAPTGRTYYVSPDGDDFASGLSERNAWRTLDKVSSTTFQPGDRILLEGGKTLFGQVVLNGSGTKEEPIVLSSYGTGMPVIKTGESEGAAVTLRNVGGWTIDGIEITSGASPEIGVWRGGVLVSVDDATARLAGITIKDCYIHDIWGQMGGTRMRSSAILVNGRKWSKDMDTVPFVLSDVLIEGNRIERVDKTGIVTDGVRDGLVVRGNYMDDLGGDGIIVSDAYRGLIERNEIHRSCLRSGYLDLPGDDGWWPHTAACWLANCEETVMQYNAVYDTGREPKNGDGEAYDFDFGCKRCVLQYNYSKENNGFLLLMYDIEDNIARYNISENDKTHLFQIQGGMEEGSLIHNNVFYVDHGTLDLDFFLGNVTDGDLRSPEQLGARFVNNVFYATGQGRFRSVYSKRMDETTFAFDEEAKAKYPAGTMFENNCYYGPWKNGLPDDSDALLEDPMFMGPGSGVHGYALMSGSPCIDAGLSVGGGGKMDFFGSPLSDGKDDVGAVEFQKH